MLAAADDPPAPAPRAARTTVGRLLFDAPPALDFARLVADLDAALAGAPGARRLRWDHEDVAILDIGACRIALGAAQGLAGRQAAAITVAVGHGEDDAEAGGEARLAQRHGMLARLIVERIAARFPARDAVWTETDDLADADLLDRLVDDLALRVDAEAEAREATGEATGEATEAAPRGRRRLGEPADLARMIDRLEATLAARRAGRPAPEAPARPHRAAPANRVPDLPRPDLSGLGAVRGALYAGPEDFATAPTPALRLAAHALDATLMVIALPVGTAMMTYSLVRGANLNASARMLAVCGMGVGAIHALGLPGLSRVLGI